MGTRPLRLALIGAGRWGKNYISTIESLKGVHLAMLVSGRSENRTLVARSCTITKNWQDAMAESEIDGIIVATPPSSHFEIAHAAIEAGKPVLVEKPLTMATEEADLLLASAIERGSTVLVGHTHLFAPAYTVLKEELGRVGQIIEIRSQGGNRGPSRMHTPMLWDWAPHDLSMCLDVMQERPSEVQAECLGQEQLEHGIGKHVRITLEFACGVRGHIEVGNILPRKVRTFEVIGEHGRLVYNDQIPEKLCIHDRTGRSAALGISDDLPLARTVEEFASLVRDPRDGLTSLRLGVAVTHLIAICSKQLDRQWQTR